MLLSNVGVGDEDRGLCQYSGTGCNIFFFYFKDIVLIENEGDVVETLTLLVFRCEGIGWRRLSH